MKLLQIDAFTSDAFKGNPAAVCFMDGARDDQWMANVAAEMNLAETAFLTPNNRDWDLRWFTPTVEVDLCGHATLASAHAIWSENISSDDVLRFHTRSGVLTAKYDGDMIELDFPAKRADSIAAPAGLLDALGVTSATYVGRNQFDYIVELPSEAEVRALTPDHGVLRQLPVRGVIVTARGTGDYDFISRFFAPGSGVDEDPVTGSSHCCLTPYWSERLGKTEMNAYQASPRGGAIRVLLDGDRVKLAGHAVTVLRGELLA
ncbi:MAG TPA: PhzF family phenazine biosynthesis protein [Thermoanaerobaculia bacterium]|nr:PhzF family phenazine biosynthesis protein [Thermoanaerobaculia bacterium]